MKELHSSPPRKILHGTLGSSFGGLRHTLSGKSSAISSPPVEVNLFPDWLMKQDDFRKLKQKRGNFMFVNVFMVCHNPFE